MRENRVRNTIPAIGRRVVSCRRCPELRRYCEEIARRRKREFADERYWGKPVPGLGKGDARLLVVGLAPAAHGGNRTGRMFTGDGSAFYLARALHCRGFATSPHSVKRNDGFAPLDAYITAALRCAPPRNKPTPAQLARCAQHMRDELAALPRLRVAVCLGKIAFDATVRRLQERGYACPYGKPKFGHGREYRLVRSGAPLLTLIGSYHPSRQNTNTGKLTEEMLDAPFARARAILNDTNTPVSSARD